MKKADACRALYALIVGDDEAATGNVSIKPLRMQGEQKAVAERDVPAILAAADR